MTTKVSATTRTRRSVGVNIAGSLLGWVAKASVGVEQTGGVCTVHSHVDIAHMRDKLHVSDEAVSPQLHRFTHKRVQGIEVLFSQSHKLLQ